MAGYGKDDVGSRQVLTLLLWVVSMETGVGASECFFTGKWIPEIARLELTCECPEDRREFLFLENLVIYKNNSRATSKVSDTRDANCHFKNCKVNSLKDRSRLEIQLYNATAMDDKGTYFCNVTGRNTKESSVKMKRLTSYQFPPIEITTSSSTVTTVKTSALSTSTLKTFHTVLPVNPNAAPTTVEKDDAFSETNLYIAVAVSCALLIVITFIIIYFIRVRARRRRQRKEQDEDIDDFNSGQPHATDYNLIYRPKAQCGAHCPHNDHCCHRAALDVCSLATCKGIGQNCTFHAQSSRALPEQQRHVFADIHRKGGRSVEMEFGRDRTPLLAVNKIPQGGNVRPDRERRSGRSQDDLRGKAKLLLDVPRSRQFRHSPGLPIAFRNDDTLDCTMPLDLDYYPRNLRYSCPRFDRDDVRYEEGFDTLPFEYHDAAAFEHPPRSFSQPSLHHLSRRRPEYDRSFRHGQRIYVDSEEQRHSKSNLYPVRPAQRAKSYNRSHLPPLMVTKDDVTMPFARPERMNDTISVNQQLLSVSDEMDGTDQTDNEALAETVLPDDGRCRTRQHRAAASDCCLTSDDERSSRSQTAGNRLDAHQQQFPTKRSRPLPHSLPSGRRPKSTSPSRHYSSTAPRPSSPSRHYSSTAPRSSSAGRSHRHGNSVQYSGSQPGTCHTSDSEASAHRVTRGYQHIPEIGNQPQQLHVSRPLPGQGAQILLSSDGDATEGLGAELRQVTPGRGVERSPELTVAEIAVLRENQEPRQSAPSAVSDAERQMNLLTSKNVAETTSSGPITTLNVPLRDEKTLRTSSPRTKVSHKGKEQHCQDSNRKPNDRNKQTIVATDQGEDSHRGPGVRPKNGPASTTGTDTSPDIATHCRSRRGSLSSSDNDNDNNNVHDAVARTSVQRVTSARGEINLRDIKSDNETRCKRPVSVRRKNNDHYHPDITYDADIAEGRGRTGCVRRTASSNSKKSSSGSVHGGKEIARQCSTRWEQLGVEITPDSPDNSVKSQCSQYTAQNHSTTVKKPYRLG